MNLLFVLGNGFDLQLGLPTSYHDFYQYYVNTPSSSKAIARLKEEISAEQHNWSDLELALGKITAKYSDVDTFCEVYDDIQIELQRYLMKLDELMQAGTITVNSTLDIFSDGLTSPEKYFSKEVKESIVSEYNRILAYHESSHIRVQILSFNYTHTVETLLHNPSLPKSIAGSQASLTYLRHIHRDLSPENSVWLGVDNEDQILNQAFRTNEEVRFRLIKPEILNEISPVIVNDIDRIISEAEVICLFGVSLGDTDITWARKLGTMVAKGVTTLLFVKDDKTFRTDNAKLVTQRRLKSQFIDKLKNVGIPITESLLDVNIEINSPIFRKDAPNPHGDNLRLLLDSLRFQNK